MKINEIDIDELHQIYSDYDGNELYNDTSYISYNYYEKEYDCLKIEDYSADLQCFKNKNIGTAWLENKPDHKHHLCSHQSIQFLLLFLFLCCYRLDLHLHLFFQNV